MSYKRELASRILRENKKKENMTIKKKKKKKEEEEEEEKKKKKKIDADSEQVCHLKQYVDL